MKSEFKAKVTVLSALLGLAMSGSASALVLSVALGDGQNDCAGYFGGTGGVICDVGFPLEEEISPIIAKSEFNDGVAGGTDTWPVFPTISGDEFSVVFDDGSDSSGTWYYTPDDDEDPVVRFWVAKGGSDEFTLFWEVDGTNLGSCDPSDPYTLACLNLALGVESGDFYTTTGQALSHISWYDTGSTDDDTTDDDVVPEPGVLFLMGAGLLGLGMARRRKAA